MKINLFAMPTIPSTLDERRVDRPQREGLEIVLL
jgi:hypothetical protein